MYRNPIGNIRLKELPRAGFFFIAFRQGDSKCVKSWQDEDVEDWSSKSERKSQGLAAHSSLPSTYLSDDDDVFLFQRGYLS